MVCRYDDSLSDLDRVLMEEKRNKTVLTEVEVVRTLKTKVRPSPDDASIVLAVVVRYLDSQ